MGVAIGWDGSVTRASGSNRTNWQDYLSRAVSRDNWFGMPVEDAKCLSATGWPEGVEKALELLEDPELDALGNSRLRRRWSDDTGETLDVARFYDGLPCYQQPYRAPGGAGGRILRLVAHAGACARSSSPQVELSEQMVVRNALFGGRFSFGRRSARTAEMSATFQEETLAG